MRFISLAMLDLHSRSALLLTVLLCSALLHAQSLTVRDQQTLQPIEGVLFRSAGTGQLSDKQGHVELAAFAGSDSIAVGHVAYGTVFFSYDQLTASNVLSLTPRVVGLPEFVMAANRFTEPRRDVPEQINTITRRTITTLDQGSTADLLQNSGALFVQKSQAGGGSPVIRGFEASRVLLVVDGVRMNNAIYRAGHLQDIMTMDQNALERIEVVSGPASVVYGSDALGGVVHMMTRSAAFSDSGTVVHGGAFFRYATANKEKTANVNFSLSGKRVSSFTNITASDFGDLRQGAVYENMPGGFGLRQFSVQRQNGQDVVVPNQEPLVQLGTAYKQLDVLEKLRVRTGNRTVHQLNLQLSTSSDVPRYDRLATATYSLVGDLVPDQAEWYYGPQKRLLAAYSLELEKRKIFDQGRITPSYQHIEQSRHNRSFGSSNLGHRTEKVDAYALNAEFEKRLTRHELRYGVEWYLNKVDSRAERTNINTGETSYLTTRYPNGGSSMNSVAAFLTHTVEVNKHWVLSEGLRYTNIALNATFADDADHQFLNGTVKQRNNALNWRAGVVYQPGHDWRFTALGSTGFRAPNVDDLGKVFDSTPGQVVVPNPDLKPERTLNAELGASKTISTIFTLEVNAFHTWYTNALVLGSYTFNGRDTIDYDGTPSRVTALTNQAKAYLYGGSANLKARFGKYLSLTSSLTYTYGRVRTVSTDVPLDHIPPIYGRTALVLNVKRIRGEFYVLYNGWKHLADYSGSGEDNLAQATANGMPPWYTLNVRAAVACTKNLSIQLALENIEDRNYRTFSSGVSAPGLNVQGSVRVVF